MDLALLDRKDENVKMKICMVTDCYLPSTGGVEIYIHSLALEFVKLGHEVHIVTHQVKNNLDINRDMDKRLFVHRLKAKEISLGEAKLTLGLNLSTQFYQIIKKYDFDIVHGHTLLSYFVFVLLWTAHKYGKITVLTEHSIISQHPQLILISKLYLKTSRFLLKNISGITFVSESVKKELQDLHKPGKVINPGVDSTRWQPDIIAKEKYRKVLRFAKNEIIIGYLSRLVKRKGVLMLIQLMPKLITEHPNVRLLLVGGGPLENKIKHKIRKMGIEHCVKILPLCPHNETPNYFNMFDIFAFPSYGEGFGLVIIEAMACGIPVVSMNNYGIKEILEDKFTGLLAESREEFYKKLVLLIENADLRNEIANNARRRIVDSYSWENIAKEVLNFYNQTIETVDGTCVKNLMPKYC